MTSHLFQLKVEKQQKASLEPVSHLQGLRDRDTVTRFDQEVSATLQCGCTLFSKLSSCRMSILLIYLAINMFLIL